MLQLTRFSGAATFDLHSVTDMSQSSGHVASAALVVRVKSAMAVRAALAAMEDRKRKHVCSFFRPSTALASRCTFGSTCFPRLGSRADTSLPQSAPECSSIRHCIMARFRHPRQTLQQVHTCRHTKKPGNSAGHRQRPVRNKRLHELRVKYTHSQERNTYGQGRAPCGKSATSEWCSVNKKKKKEECPRPCPYEFLSCGCVYLARSS